MNFSDPGYWPMVMHVLIAAMCIGGSALVWVVAVTMLLCVVTRLFAGLFGRWSCCSVRFRYLRLTYRSLYYNALLGATRRQMREKEKTRRGGRRGGL